MHGTFLMHSLAVLSHLRPRVAYILDHYGHARSRRRASARRVKVPFYVYLHLEVGISLVAVLDV